MDSIATDRLWELKGIIITMGAFARSATSTCASNDEVDHVTELAAEIVESSASYVARLQEENRSLKREIISLNILVEKLQKECERLEEEGEG